MVIKQLYKVMVGIFLTITFFSQAIAQNNSGDFEIFKNYSQWGFTLKPLIYSKAQSKLEYGNLELKNKNMYSFNAGVEYKFNTNQKWSFITGIYINKEPVSNFNYAINETNIEENVILYNQITYSFPILMEYKYKVSKKIFFNFHFGTKVLYTPPSYIEYILIDQTNSNQSINTLEIYINSPDDRIFHGNFIFATGIYKIFDPMILHINILYNSTFQNLFEGEYFEYLYAKPPSKGTYTVSGNYFGLSLTAYFKRK